MNNNLIKLHIDGRNVYVCAGHILWFAKDLVNDENTYIRFENSEIIVDEPLEKVLNLLTSIKEVSVVWGDRFQDPFVGQ